MQVGRVLNNNNKKTLNMLGCLGQLFISNFYTSKWISKEVVPSPNQKCIHFANSEDHRVRYTFTEE